MRIETIDLASEADVDDVETTLHAYGREDGLIVGITRSLGTITGSRHWHVKSNAGTGTIEVTVVPRRRQILVAVHKNRRGTWACTSLSGFAEALRTRLQSGK